MPVQTTYASVRPVAFEGMRANLGLTNITSKVAEDSAVPFGRAVTRGTADNQCKLPTATGEDFLGVSEMTSAWSENSDDLHVYEEYREVNIVDFGSIWVYTEQSVVPGNSVFFRHTADTAPLDVLGRFRKDSSGGDADQVLGATFETTAAAGELARIKLNASALGLLIVPDSAETLTATTSAISILTGITYFDTTLGAMAASLADGVEGQVKRLMMTVDGGDVVITPTNLALGATLRLTEAFDWIDLRFTGTSWKEIGRGGRAIVTILATGAIPLDIDILLLDTVSTVAQADTLADGYPGQRMTMKMTVDGTANAVVTPANLLDGTTITFDDAGDSCELIFDGTNWGVIGTATATVA